ncbi:unnamed protein product [Amoebophrya sp. A25]|nr:unnamed protein product [Amoebophrya sp. A25]|eukprot:GSA25T00017371001.1
MGIPQYFSWLKQKFPGSFQDGTPRKLNLTNVEHCYIDLNCYLHNVVRRATNFDTFVGLVKREVEGLLNQFPRDKTVYLAVDGPAARAKVLLQRKRRRAKQSSSFSIGISPGTTLMRKLCDGLREWCATLAKKRSIEVTLSDGFVPGEGEHKIISAIMTNQAKSRGAHCVVGSDSDLFLIVLGAAAKNVYTWDGEHRPGIVFTRNNMVNRILESCTGMKNASQGQQQMQRGSLLHSGSALETAIRLDFSLLSLLRGDDYLPSLVTFEAAYKVYEQLVKPVCQKQAVDKWAIIKRNLSGSSAAGKNLGENAGDLAGTHDFFDSDSAAVLDDYGAALHSFRANETLPQCIAGLNAHKQLVVAGGANNKASGAGGADAILQKITPECVDVITNYLQGLCWVLDIYQNGRPLDYHYVCRSTGESSTARTLPRLDETLVAAWMLNHKREFGSIRGAVNLDAPDTGNPLHPTTAAMCLIPSNSIKSCLDSETWKAVSELLKPATDTLLGPVVLFEDDPEVKRLKANLGVESAEYNKRLTFVQVYRPRMHRDKAQDANCSDCLPRSPCQF